MSHTLEDTIKQETPLSNKCVYFHMTPDTGRVFYVGMGFKNRSKKFHGRNRYRKAIVEKHGLPIILIVHEDLSNDEAGELEKFWIKYHGLENLTNINSGGDNITGFIQSDETRRKISESKKGKKLPPRTDEHRNKMSAALKGRIRTKEHARKISEALKGEKHVNFGKKLPVQFVGVGDKNPSFDHTEYEFYHPKHGCRKCKQYELRKEFNLTLHGVSKLVKGRIKTHKGWKIVTHS